MAYNTTYDVKIKKLAVERVLAGESRSQVAYSLGIEPHTVGRWVFENKYAVKQEFKPVIDIPPVAEVHIHEVPPQKPSDIINKIAASADAEKSQIPARSSKKIKPSTGMVIPDLHCPFEHIDALAFCLAVKEKFNPDYTICLGDEIDAHAFSDKYAHDPDGMTAGQELQKAIEHLVPWYVEFPVVKVCESNHTSRPLKLAFRAGLPAAFLPSYSTMLNAPDGWEWANRHTVDDVLYMHGDNGSSGQFAAIGYMRALKTSLVIGHTHSFSSVFYEDRFFAANSGCLIDKTRYCFAYSRNMVTEPTLGCTIVHEGRWAEFIPMLLDKNRRWIGKI